ncbi:MAG TPA: HAMP domain-containing sensor histidine kinase [Bryobacteraceae bacterium]|nr:HAMP domain-containing sensor histidine kinase [Bryobacteraceae bacterium]
MRSNFSGAAPAALFLLAAVAAPTACVFWFMNEAARGQAEAAKRSVTEAYRGQLRLLRDRIDSYWEARAAALQRSAGARTPDDFRRLTAQGGVDSVVFLGADGSVAYPIPVPAFVPNAPTTAEQRAQEQIRALVQRGEREAAMEAIEKNFSGGGTGTIAADEQLLLLHLAKPGDPRYRRDLRRLTALINDYSRPMPSAHRLFLMDELGKDFPTYAAERLAAQFVEAGGAYSLDASLQRTRLPDVWQLASPNRRAVALFRTDTVLAAMRSLIEPLNSPSRVRFAVAPPGASNGGEAIAAGGRLPGWQIGFSSVDPGALDAVGRQRMATYLWIGYIAITAIVLTGLAAGQYFRRQLRLARLKTDLVAAVSHELKTPLASMRVLVDALLEEESLDPSKTREYLQLISGENLRLTRLIENFLAFARIERRQRFEFAETDPHRVIQSAASVIRERVPIAVQVDPDLPRVNADEDALVSVLLNLLDNACKFTPLEKDISLRAYRDGTSLIFAVKDNGVGIPPREQKRIFRKFYQVDQRLARETGGCGLGLSIVDYIVRAHGGSVRVQSRAGAGSTFLVCLPCRGF